MEFFVYTIEHVELLKEIIGDTLCRPQTAPPANLDTMAEALALAAIHLFPILNFKETKGLFKEFLTQNNYIFFDGFLRICIFEKESYQ